MIVVSVMYPRAEGARFDEAYYLRTHIPLVRDRWSAFGLQDVRVLKGASDASGGEPAYAMIALLTFGSLDDFKRAGREHGKEVFADIARFTDAQPTMQISDVVG